METVFINISLCIGCRHCEIACITEHSAKKDLSSVLNDEPRPFPRIKVGLGIDLLTFPNRCRHCDPAPCMQTCPTGAIFRDVDHGSVLIKEDKCISCGMCAMVCPFSAIIFHSTSEADNQISYKCDDCIDRRREEIIPACVDACKTDALLFGEINEIISKSKQDVVMKITSDIKGIKSFQEPGNIVIFKGIMEKIAGLGPLPSSNQGGNR